MRDDAVFDAGIDFGRQDSVIEEFVLATVGAEANDACCPGAGQAGKSQELIEGRGVDVERIPDDSTRRNLRLSVKHESRAGSGDHESRDGDCAEQTCT